eukprot:Rhum_TRINITY_DN14603_c4_g1::Rhum_TRINITY_DN14603_c4_g1_i1::g.103840::m.103840
MLDHREVQPAQRLQGQRPLGRVDDAPAALDAAFALLRVAPLVVDAHRRLHRLLHRLLLALHPRQVRVLQRVLRRAQARFDVAEGEVAVDEPEVAGVAVRVHHEELEEGVSCLLVLLLVVHLPRLLHVHRRVVLRRQLRQVHSHVVLALRVRHVVQREHRRRVAPVPGAGADERHRDVRLVVRAGDVKGADVAPALGQRVHLVRTLLEEGHPVDVGALRHHRLDVFVLAGGDGRVEQPDLPPQLERRVLLLQKLPALPEHLAVVAVALRAHRLKLLARRALRRDRNILRHPELLPPLERGVQQLFVRQLVGHPAHDKVSADDTVAVLVALLVAVDVLVLLVVLAQPPPRPVRRLAAVLRRVEVPVARLKVLLVVRHLPLARRRREQPRRHVLLLLPLPLPHRVPVGRLALRHDEGARHLRRVLQRRHHVLLRQDVVLGLLGLRLRLRLGRRRRLGVAFLFFLVLLVLLSRRALRERQRACTLRHRCRRDGRRGPLRRPVARRLRRQRLHVDARDVEGVVLRRDVAGERGAEGGVADGAFRGAVEVRAAGMANERARFIRRERLHSLLRKPRARARREGEGDGLGSLVLAHHVACLAAPVCVVAVPGGQRRVRGQQRLQPRRVLHHAHLLPRRRRRRRRRDRLARRRDGRQGVVARARHRPEALQALLRRRAGAAVEARRVVAARAVVGVHRRPVVRLRPVLLDQLPKQLLVAPAELRQHGVGALDLVRVVVGVEAEEACARVRRLRHGHDLVAAERRRQLDAPATLPALGLARRGGLPAQPPLASLHHRLAARPLRDDHLVRARLRSVLRLQAREDGRRRLAAADLQHQVVDGGQLHGVPLLEEADEAGPHRRVVRRLRRGALLLPRRLRPVPLHQLPHEVFLLPRVVVQLLAQVRLRQPVVPAVPLEPLQVRRRPRRRLGAEAGDVAGEQLLLAADVSLEEAVDVADAGRRVLPQQAHQANAGVARLVRRAGGGVRVRGLRGGGGGGRSR